MLGRYFARFDESPTNKLMINGSLRQGVLGRGLQPRPELAALRSGRQAAELAFEEGVDSYVAYAGALHDNVATSLYQGQAPPCATAA